MFKNVNELQAAIKSLANKGIANPAECATVPAGTAYYIAAGCCGDLESVVYEYKINSDRVAEFKLLGVTYDGEKVAYRDSDADAYIDITVDADTDDEFDENLYLLLSELQASYNRLQAGKTSGVYRLLVEPTPAIIEEFNAIA